MSNKIPVFPVLHIHFNAPKYWSGKITFSVYCFVLLLAMDEYLRRSKIIQNLSVSSCLGSRSHVHLINYYLKAAKWLFSRFLTAHTRHAVEPTAMQSLPTLLAHNKLTGRSMTTLEHSHARYEKFSKFEYFIFKYLLKDITIMAGIAFIPANIIQKAAFRL